VLLPHMHRLQDIDVVALAGKIAHASSNCWRRPRGRRGLGLEQGDFKSRGGSS